MTDYLNSCSNGACGTTTATDYCIEASSGNPVQSSASLVEFYDTGSSITYETISCTTTDGRGACENGACRPYCDSTHHYNVDTDTCDPNTCTPSAYGCEAISSAYGIDYKKCSPDGTSTTKAGTCADTLGVCGYVLCTDNSNPLLAPTCNAPQSADGATCGKHTLTGNGGGEFDMLCTSAHCCPQYNTWNGLTCVYGGGADCGSNLPNTANICLTDKYRNCVSDSAGACVSNSPPGNSRSDWVPLGDLRYHLLS